MKVSRNWLQNFFDSPLPGVEEIAEALTFHAFEIDGIERAGADDVLDVKVTPNRGHDALSHRAIAKELSAILRIPLTKDPFARPRDFSNVSREVTVDVETPLCARYIAAHIKGVAVGPSPEWLRQSLEAIGQRSINNVVDATNFVMFNVGQPLHAFDAGRLGSLALGVRLAAAGEELEALDKKKYALSEQMMVITAGGRPVGIAGIKGGMADRIDEATQDIVLESATFDGATIRKAAQALRLRTDASSRFEQELSPELAGYGMAQAVDLVLSLAGGTVEGYVDMYKEPHKLSAVAVTTAKVNRVLGTALTDADIASVLERLGFAYKEESGVFEVQPPSERLDIGLEEDLVEEVGRIIGYDRVPAAALPPHEGAAAVNPNFFAAERAREGLIAQGYSEVYTSVFAERGERAVANKIDSIRPYLRDSLIPGLTAALALNKQNKDLLGLDEVKLFEIGVVWKGGREEVLVGTISEKAGAAENPLSVESAARYDNLPLAGSARFKPFSRYPYIVRDIAMWVPEGTDEAAVEDTIKRETGELCVAVRLFDRFQKEGRVSLGYRIVFQSFDRTLTEAEVNQIMLKINDILAKKGFEIR